MKKTLITAAAAAALTIGVGCDNNKYERSPSPPAPAVDNSRGTGGSGSVDFNSDRSGSFDSDGKRIGDGKIGKNEGVLNDGEGPLENNPDTDRSEAK